MATPKTATVQEIYSLHLIFDNPGITPGGYVSSLEGENLFGHLAGVAPGVTPMGSRISPYADFDSGATVTYGATTCTDTAKAWATDQWKGRVVIGRSHTGTLTLLVVTSNSATVLTGSAGWTNGTPDANSLYIVAPLGEGIAVASPPGTPKLFDNWESEYQVNGNTNAI